VNVIQQCHAVGVFQIFFFNMYEIILCRKPEVILDLFFAFQDCGAYFDSFSLFWGGRDGGGWVLVCFLFSQKRLVMSMKE